MQPDWSGFVEAPEVSSSAPPSSCGVAAADYPPAMACLGCFAAPRLIVQLDFMVLVPPGRSAAIEEQFV